MSPSSSLQKDGQDLVLALSASRLFFATGTFLAASALFLRRRAAAVAGSAAALWNSARSKADPFLPSFSVSDLAFLSCLLVLWAAIYAVCVWDDPTAIVGGVVGTPVAAVLGALETLGSALAALPSALLLADPATIRDIPTPDQSSGPSVGHFDTESLARKILSSEEFSNRIRDLTAKYTRPVREELMAYTEEKVKRLLEAGEAEMGAELSREIEARLEEVRISTEKRISEETKELERGFVELESIKTELERKVSSCCNKQARGIEVSAIRAEAEAAVDKWAERVVALDQEEGGSESVRRFKEHLRKEFVSRSEVDLEVSRLAHSLSAEIRAEMLLWAEKNAEATSASTVEEMMRNSTLVSMFRERIAADLSVTSGVEVSEKLELLHYHIKAL